MVEPYINLKGQASDAVEFYERVFGGENKRVMRFSDMPANPDFPVPDHMKDWIGHAEMTIRGTVFNFSDTQPDTVTNGIISLMVRFDTVEEITETYNKLLEGGQALMELTPQFYAKSFGWVRDKFGVDWQLICE